MSVETAKFMVMALLTVNLKQIFRHVDATLPKYLIRHVLRRASRRLSSTPLRVQCCQHTICHAASGCRQLHQPAASPPCVIACWFLWVSISVCDALRRAYGCDVPVGSIYGINPGIIIFLVPLVLH